MWKPAKPTVEIKMPEMYSPTEKTSATKATQSSKPILRFARFERKRRKTVPKAKV